MHGGKQMEGFYEVTKESLSWNEFGMSSPEFKMSQTCISGRDLLSFWNCYMIYLKSHFMADESHRNWLTFAHYVGNCLFIYGESIKKDEYNKFDIKF